MSKAEGVECSVGLEFGPQPRGPRRKTTTTAITLSSAFQSLRIARRASKRRCRGAPHVRSDSDRE